MKRHPHYAVILLSLLLLTGCTNSPSQQAYGPKKPVFASMVISDLNKLSIMAKNNRNTYAISSGDRSHIETMIAKYRDPEALEFFARLCAEIPYPGYNENVTYDMVFDDAFWECISRLASIGNREAKQCLRELREKYCNDGGASLLFNSTMEYYKLDLTGN